MATLSRSTLLPKENTGRFAARRAHGKPSAAATARQPFDQVSHKNTSAIFGGKFGAGKKADAIKPAAAKRATRKRSAGSQAPKETGAAWTSKRASSSTMPSLKDIDESLKSLSHGVAPMEDVMDDVMDIDSSILDMSLEDIDEHDKADPQAVSDLVSEIYLHLRRKEKAAFEKRNFSYMDLQSELKPKMRKILIEWLIQVHLKFKLLNDTLYLTIDLIDRYLQKKRLPRKKLQLLGVSCMLVACKYEEIYSPELKDFEYMCDHAYKSEEILIMERELLNTLSFELTHPTAIHFLRRYSKAAKSDSKSHTLGKYLLELSLPEYKGLQFPPSMLAAGAVFVTRKMLNPRLYWNSTMRYYTNFTETDLAPVIGFLTALVRDAQLKKSSSAVFKKYCRSRFEKVALVPAP